MNLVAKPMKHAILCLPMQDQNKQKNQPKATLKSASSIQTQAAAAGIRFASHDSVKVASSWMIARYAGTFKKLAE
jgi:hypothetical protein